jgi:hypothetical protein
MLYQDTLTGMLHEVPDSQVQGFGLAEDPYGEAQMVYDGLGNPLGWSFFKSIKGLVKKALPIATSMLGPYGQIINRALPVVSQVLSEAPEFGELPVALPRPPGMFPAPIARPWPAGWRRPQLPYTGPRPHRLYLRCSTWRGPSGLVPINAAQTPAVAPPGVLPPAAAPAMGVRRHRGRRRR